MYSNLTNKGVQMKQLGAQFGQVQHLQISDLSCALGLSKSDIARAALSLGLSQIRVLAAKDLDKARSLTAVSSAKAKL